MPLAVARYLGEDLRPFRARSSVRGLASHWTTSLDVDVLREKKGDSKGDAALGGFRSRETLLFARAPDSARVPSSSSTMGLGVI